MVHLVWHRQLAERWKQRRASIATATGRKPPARLVLLPETAVLVGGQRRGIRDDE